MHVNFKIYHNNSVVRSSEIRNLNVDNKSQDLSEQY